MASALQRKLEDQLNCSICLDTYTNPKQLQCHHVFCSECLIKLVTRDQWRQPILICPNCRHVTPVPANGVTGLQAAFQIIKLLEIMEEHKAAIEVMDAIKTPIHKVVCPEHDQKEVELYCETCGETICWECIMIGSKHHSHRYHKIEQKDQEDYFNIDETDDDDHRVLKQS